MSILEKLKKMFTQNACDAASGVYKSGTAKYSLNSACSLEFSANMDLKRKEIDAHLKQLAKKYINEPEKLLQYMKLKGAQVYKIKNAAGILGLFGEEEGFSAPAKGLKAAVFYMLISFLAEKKLKISFSAPAMAVFDANNTEIYTIIRALHKFTGYKNNLPGFDSYSQSIFKKIYGSRKSSCGSALIDNASLKDICACRYALLRDLDSINFTIQLSMEYGQSKKTLEKLLKDRNVKV